jgi:hypothetical protein
VTIPPITPIRAAIADTDPPMILVEFGSFMAFIRDEDAIEIVLAIQEALRVKAEKEKK